MRTGERGGVRWTAFVLSMICNFNFFICVWMLLDESLKCSAHRFLSYKKQVYWKDLPIFPQKNRKLAAFPNELSFYVMWYINKAGTQTLIYGAETGRWEMGLFLICYEFQKKKPLTSLVPEMGICLRHPQLHNNKSPSLLLAQKATSLSYKVGNKLLASDLRPHSRWLQ